MGRAPNQPRGRHCLQRFLIKRRKSYNRRRGPEDEGVVPFIHNIVNIHSLYYMCFSLVFACLSVWELDLRSLVPLLPAATSLPHPGSRGWNRSGCQAWWEPAGGAWASASTVLCTCMYVHGEPVCEYVQGERVTVTQRLGAGRAAQGKACLGGWLTSRSSVGLRVL